MILSFLSKIFKKTLKEGHFLSGYTICFNKNGFPVYLPVNENNCVTVYRIINKMDEKKSIIEKAIIVDNIIYLDPSITKEKGLSLKSIWKI